MVDPVRDHVDAGRGLLLVVRAVRTVLLDRDQDRRVVLALLEEVLGRKAHKNLLPMQPGDVAATYADVESLHRTTGFSPQTSMREGVQRFVEWYKAFYGVT